MAIKGNRNFGGTDQGPSVDFTKEEAAFIAGKLQQASYQGAEFDNYYKIMLKLKSLIEKS